MVRAPLTLATISGLLIGATATAPVHPPPSSLGWDNFLLVPEYGLPSTIRTSKSSFGIQRNRFHGARRKERIMADLEVRQGSWQGVLSLRGGENLQAIDLERVDLRLGSLEEYCLIASIILGAVIEIYSGSSHDESDSKVEQVAQAIHMISICLSFFAAVYTTVVFALFGLYAKTALGTGDDFAYFALLEATTKIRYRGFQSFLVCLFSFHTSFLVNLFLKHSGIARWIIVSLSVAGTTISAVHVRFIVNKATEIIFR